MNNAPRVTRFDVNADMLVDMLIPGSRLRVKSVREIDRPGFGPVVAFEVEHECIDIPAGYVSLSFREITAIGGARVSIFNAADSVAEPVYPRAPYETPKLEAAYKARELAALFAKCTPEERACVLDYLDADPRAASPPLTDEQAAVVKALVEEGIAYARRFFGDFATGGVVGEGSLFSPARPAGLMGENGPEAIVPHVTVAEEACAHRFVRTGFDPDGPVVKCADCGELIKRMGVVQTGTAGDPIDDAAVAVAIAKTYPG